MADWTDQDINSLLPGEPWTSAKAIASFENPVAIAEGAPDAPIIAAGWHPYNGTINGGSTGLIYDHAADGNTTTIQTPVLSGDFEWMLSWVDLRGTNAIAATLTADFRLTETGSYTVTGLNLASIQNRISGGSIRIQPQNIDRIVNNVVAAYSSPFLANAGLENMTRIEQFFTRTAGTRIDRMRLVCGQADGIIGGRAYLFRRRFEGF